MKTMIAGLAALAIALPALAHADDADPIGDLLTNVAAKMKAMGASFGLKATLYHGGGGMSAHDAMNGAYGQVYRSLQLQASTLSYIDTFWLLTLAAGIMFCMAFVLKRNDPRGGGEKVIAH